MKTEYNTPKRRKTKQKTPKPHKTKENRKKEHHLFSLFIRAHS
jgi:hypothetical protein